MKGRWNQLRWGSAQAGVSLSLASTAWLLSGLTPSPLLNTLLPVLTTLPALLAQVGLFLTAPLLLKALR